MLLTEDTLSPSLLDLTKYSFQDQQMKGYVSLHRVKHAIHLLETYLSPRILNMHKYFKTKEPEKYSKKESETKPVLVDQMNIDMRPIYRC